MSILPWCEVSRSMECALDVLDVCPRNVSPRFKLVVFSSDMKRLFTILDVVDSSFMLFLYTTTQLPEASE